MSNKTIKGKRDYREKEVNGMLASGLKFKACKIVVRMTSDNLGQSLSLCADGLMLQITLESVKEIIKVVEKEDK